MEISTRELRVKVVYHGAMIRKVLISDADTNVGRAVVERETRRCLDREWMLRTYERKGSVKESGRRFKNY